MRLKTHVYGNIKIIVESAKLETESWAGGKKSYRAPHPPHETLQGVAEGSVRNLSMKIVSE